MKCNKCGTELEEGRKFCSNCGEKVDRLCPNCYAVIPETEKFCHQCGCSLDKAEEKAAAENEITVGNGKPNKIEEISNHTQDCNSKIPISKKFFIIIGTLLLCIISTQVIGGWLGIALLACVYIGMIAVCKKITAKSTEDARVFINGIFAATLFVVILYSIIIYGLKANREISDKGYGDISVTEKIEAIFSGDYKTWPDKSEYITTMPEEGSGEADDSFESYLNQAVTVSGEDLVRNPDLYIGQKIALHMNVTQKGGPGDLAFSFPVGSENKELKEYLQSLDGWFGNDEYLGTWMILFDNRYDKSIKVLNGDSFTAYGIFINVSSDDTPIILVQYIRSDNKEEPEEYLGNVKADSYYDSYYSDDNYILSESDSRYYTVEELQVFSHDELRLARNEIYARKGRKFESEDLNQYFSNKSWYSGTLSQEEFNDSLLNEFEKENVGLIVLLENDYSFGNPNMIGIKDIINSEWGPNNGYGMAVFEYNAGVYIIITNNDISYYGKAVSTGASEIADLYIQFETLEGSDIVDDITVVWKSSEIIDYPEVNGSTTGVFDGTYNFYGPYEF